MDHSHRTLQDLSGGDLEHLVIHIEAYVAHIAHHIGIHHRALSSVLDEDLDTRLIDVGLTSHTVESEGKYEPDGEDVDVPEA